MRARLTAVSFGLATAAAIVLLVVPIYSNSMTLLQVNGPYAIIPVMFPVVAAVLPLLFKKQIVRIAAAVLMGAFALISFTIGLFYLPAAVVMFLAVRATPPT